jgi:hypothetical protein
MGDSAYRDSDENLKAALSELTRRADELGPHVDRGALMRHDVDRLHGLEAKWTAARIARKALDDDSGWESLVRAVEAHRTLVPELEGTVAWLQERRTAEERREAAFRFARHVIFALVMIVALALSGCVIYSCDWILNHRLGGYM